MSTKQDGGHAFPHDQMARDRGCGGMTLRDWFAGRALSGMGYIAATPEAEAGKARAAYRIADAMLAEREKGGVR